MIHFFAVLDSEETLTPRVEVVDQVVEHTPRNIKVVGLNPTWCSSLSSSSKNKAIAQWVGPGELIGAKALFKILHSFKVALYIS